MKIEKKSNFKHRKPPNHQYNATKHKIYFCTNQTFDTEQFFYGFSELICDKTRMLRIPTQTEQDEEKSKCKNKINIGFIRIQTVY